MISRRGFISALLTLPLVGKALVAAGVNPVRVIVTKKVPDRLFCMVGYIREHDGMKEFRPLELDKGEFGKRLNDPELDKPSPYYMPDADPRDVENWYTGGGSYMPGDTFLMPKKWYEKD